MSLENAPLTIKKIQELSTQVRLTLLEMIHSAQSGHFGSSLSCVDIISVLKFDQMHWQADGDRSESDVFILSKGHAVSAWYAALIVSGEIDSKYIHTLRQLDSPFQGHPDRNYCDWIDVSTGALGQGLSVGLGRAQAKRLKQQKSFVFCIIGDGECQEGQTWEATMYAGFQKISNIILFIDYNNSQGDGKLDEILELNSFSTKYEAFHWHVQEVDGHSHECIRQAVLNAKGNQNQPSVIITHTQKGYLHSNQVLLNGAHSGKLSPEEFETAIASLKGTI